MVNLLGLLSEIYTMDIENFRPKITTMRRLYRSKNDKMIAGICGGLGEYFDVDPVVFRVLFVILLLPGGLPGLIPYILLWILVPEKPAKPLKDKR